MAKYDNLKKYGIRARGKGAIRASEHYILISVPIPFHMGDKFVRRKKMG